MLPWVIIVNAPHYIHLYLQQQQERAQCKKRIAIKRNCSLLSSDVLRYKKYKVKNEN